MKIYGKSWDYNICDCRYCLYWKGKKTGCTYGDGCCCDIPQIPPGAERCEDSSPPPVSEPVSASECHGCPYWRASPCIGWCTKKILKEMGM